MKSELSSADLFAKYTVPGPRYTSYPTVPYWSDSPTATEWIEALSASLRDSLARRVGAALYVHVPFCQSLCTYCGCNTRITRNRAVALPYVDTVLREWQLYRQALEPVTGGARIPLTEFHLGGGTPTFLEPAELSRLVGGILEHCEVTPEHEFSVEADPRVTRREHLIALREWGFKRLSLGIQDFDPRVQAIVHREQSVEQVREVVEQARDLGYTSINFDLIYGLPLQTRESVAHTLEEVNRLRPDRIAFYSYAHVPWIKPGQRRFTEADLPTGVEKRGLYELGRQSLEAAGYREVGMDHFALEHDGLWRSTVDGTLHRNFMGYTTRFVAPQFGLGVSAIGDAWTAFAQNEKSLETYEARVAAGELPLLRGHKLDAEDQVLRRHVLSLMTRFGTQWSETPGVEHLATVPEQLQELQRDGLVEMGATEVNITPRGRPFLRNVCMAFDARLKRQAPATQLFSSTV